VPCDQKCPLHLDMYMMVNSNLILPPLPDPPTREY
jgi:hypothetical protein